MHISVCCMHLEIVTTLCLLIFVIKNVCGELRVKHNILLCFLVVCGSVHDYNRIDCLEVCFVRVYYMCRFIR